MLPKGSAFIFIFLSFVIYSAQEKPPSIAIMDFEGRAIPKSDAAALTDRFRYELMKTKKFDVMERNQMNVILEEQKFQMTGCVDQSCAVEAGQLIAVNKIITGSVAKVGGIYTLNVKMLDVATGKIDQNLNEDCDCPVEKVLTETIKRLALKMAGVEVAENQATIAVQRGDASLYVKTDPPGASVYIDGRLLDGRTPCAFENLTSGKHSIMAKTSDMIEKKDVDLVSNQVLRIALKLQKQRTTLKVTSDPSEAEVYLDRKPGINAWPNQLAPAIFDGITPGRHEIRVTKVGFRDTMVETTVTANEETPISVKLSEAPTDLVRAQKALVRDRSHRRTATYVWAGTLAAAIAGGTCLFLAQRDYGDALSAKDYLDHSTIRTGSEYDAKVKENTDKTSAGDIKSGVSAVLFGIGGVCLAVGLVIWF